MTDAHSTTAVSASPAMQVLAPFAAWLLPGLGHIIIGQRTRGLILMITILGLFLAGLLIGGIDVVDARNDRLWFIGQALAGPVAPATAAVNSYMQRQLAHQVAITQQTVYEQRGRSISSRQALEQLLAQGRPPAYTVSLGRINELGTLYCAMAGLLNLLVIVDLIQTPDSSPAAKRASSTGRLVQREPPA
jgi:TM2 domain-containing membrane protein YozV